jgi:hypothetical protein
MRLETVATLGKNRRPVLYLDIDDTLLSWRNGKPQAATGARSFMLWALERFEVRWLTTWCPVGELSWGLLGDLCKMLELEPSRLRGIRGVDWEATGSKLNGIAWLEHVVLRRPFVWVEDEYGFGDAERAFLEHFAFLGSYRHCNVTEDAAALERLHTELAGEWEAGAFRDGWCANRALERLSAIAAEEAA